MNEGQNVVVKAVIHSVETANPTLKSLLELHLKTTTGEGFEIAYNDPKRFKEAVSKLFGEYSSRLLEMLVISYFRDKIGLREELNSLEELVQYVKKIYG